MTTVADLLEGVPVWAAPARGLCTYCATPGRERVQILPPAPPPGCCRVCGEKVESLRCVPGVECDPPHDECHTCATPASTCSVCWGASNAPPAPVVGCVACHGTNLVLPAHCCGCGVPAGGCLCLLLVEVRPEETP